MRQWRQKRLHFAPSEQIIRRIEEGVSPKSDRTLALGHIDQTRTGTRSVSKYIAKPVFKTFGGAMSER